MKESIRREKLLWEADFLFVCKSINHDSMSKKYPMISSRDEFTWARQWKIQIQIRKKGFTADIWIQMCNHIESQMDYFNFSIGSTIRFLFGFVYLSECIWNWFAERVRHNFFKFKYRFLFFIGIKFRKRKPQVIITPWGLFERSWHAFDLFKSIIKSEFNWYD